MLPVLTAPLAAPPLPRPHLAWVSDRALVVAPDATTTPDQAVLATWRALAAAPLDGVLDIQPTARTVMVTCDLRAVAPSALMTAVRHALTTPRGHQPPPAATVELPVFYGPPVAPDLAAVAAYHGLSPAEVVRRHAGATYRVAFLGFAPGFAYLDGLPAELATPRLPSPRRQVPAGSVGIGGSHTGVYPLAAPGGWHLIGWTPTVLFDPRRQPLSLLAPGDEVRFVPAPDPAPPADAPRWQGDSWAPAAADRAYGKAAVTPQGACLEILAPGLASTVQDLGRPGWAHLGVSPCGAADSLSHTLGNRLVGNHDNAATVEMTLVGATVRFADRRSFALTGSDFGATLARAGGGVESVCPWASVLAHRGDVLRVGPTRQGARAYLCVAGGVATPPVLGSRATHARSGLGGLEGRALRAGDCLPLGVPSGEPLRRRLADRAVAAIAARLFPPELRLVDGPQCGWLATDELAAWSFEVSEASDRLGLRLNGPALHRRPSHATDELATAGAPLGAVQVTPNGQLIILGIDQQTTGGYPQLGCVIAADLPALGQLRPRAAVRFASVSLEEAWAACRALTVQLDALLPPAPGDPV
jgi:KipI family sensor histidine kinase inhibitor